jgi:hypothetical protein
MKHKAPPSLSPRWIKQTQKNALHAIGIYTPREIAAAERAAAKREAKEAERLLPMRTRIMEEVTTRLVRLAGGKMHSSWKRSLDSAEHVLKIYKLDAAERDAIVARVAGKLDKLKLDTGEREAILDGVRRALEPETQKRRA